MLIDVCRLMNVDKTSFDEVDGDAPWRIVLNSMGKCLSSDKIVLPPFSFTVLSVSPKRIERIKVQIDK